MRHLLLWLAAVAAPAFAQDPAPGDPIPVEIPPIEEAMADEAEGEEAADAELASWQREGLGFGGVPALNYNTDEGFGFGIVGNIYKYNGVSNPYKWNLGLLVFTTTKGIHDHRIEIDALDIGGSPLRLTARANLVVTRAGNFCGFGNDVTCDPQEAEDLADDLGLTGEERDDLLRRYYLVRFVRPYAYVIGRYAIDPMPHKVELFGGWRGEWHQPGDFTTSEPYENSKYTTFYPEGEKGFLSILQGGIMVDNRDIEASPTRGYWAEASIRGAAPFLGSAWGHFGFNASVRGYLPFTDDGRLVSASRVVFDGWTGEAPAREWSQVGGWRIYEIYGSQNAGRGIRSRRYLGKFRLFAQEEIRAVALRTKLFGTVPFDLAVLGFYDIGFVGEEWSDAGDALATPLWGTGGGVRLAFDTNFIIRLDLGFSPVEDYGMGMYLNLGHLY